MEIDENNYAVVAERLERVVKKLEAGDLSLEDSLQAFEEGIGLVRRGEKLLGDAEKKIEQLLSQGSAEKIVPLAVKNPAAAPAPAKATQPEEDVPF